MKKKKVVIAGGTGFLGNSLVDRFHRSGAEVIVLTRGAAGKNSKATRISWDAKTPGEWVKALEGADLLINLSGKSVDCRYTEENKKEIIASRVDATNALAEAVGRCAVPPKVWMNSASATIYRHAEDRAMDESEGETGEGFSVEVCKLWEQAFNNAHAPQTRKVTLRISMILGKSGGVLPVLAKLVRFGLGGTQGNGRQYVSWMHEDDFLNAIEWLAENGNASGPYNLAAPEPLPNKAFMKQMREAMGRPFGLPAAAWMLEIGAFFIRTETELVLKSRRVIPGRLLSEGFKFRYPTVREALNHLLR